VSHTYFVLWGWLATCLLVHMDALQLCAALLKSPMYTKAAVLLGALGHVTGFATAKGFAAASWHVMCTTRQ
jgi:hypothetical protein